MDSEISSEQKLDYIYETLKKNEKKDKIAFYFKWWYRLFILWYFYYFFAISLPAILDKVPSFKNPNSSMNLEEIRENPKVKEFLDIYFSN